MRGADRVLASRPDDAMAHLVKALASNFKQQRRRADQRERRDRNRSEFRARLWRQEAYLTLVSGRAAEAVEPAEQALRLDPLDPGRDLTEYNLCYAHAHLAHWEQAIESCGKAAAINPSNLYPYFELAAAYAWLGRRAEASHAVVRTAEAEAGRHRSGLSRDEFVRATRPSFAGETGSSRGYARRAYPRRQRPELRRREMVHGRQYRRHRGRMAVGTGDMTSDKIYNGFRQAEIDLGPSVTYAYAHWDPTSRWPSFRSRSRSRPTAS